VIIDDRVEVVIAGAVLAVAAAMLGRVAAMDSVATAIAQPPELLDVHVDQLARSGAFIAADQLAGGPIQAGQPVQPWRHSTR
jgi:hypothetical protein